MFSKCYPVNKMENNNMQIRVTFTGFTPGSPLPHFIYFSWSFSTLLFFGFIPCCFLRFHPMLFSSLLFLPFFSLRFSFFLPLL